VSPARNTVRLKIRTCQVLNLTFHRMRSDAARWLRCGAFSSLIFFLRMLILSVLEILGTVKTFVGASLRSRQLSVNVDIERSWKWCSKNWVGPVTGTINGPSVRHPHLLHLVLEGPCAGNGAFTSVRSRHPLVYPNQARCCNIRLAYGQFPEEPSYGGSTRQRDVYTHPPGGSRVPTPCRFKGFVSRIFCPLYLETILVSRHCFL
jgi:hypothetical protein